eukprot:SAG31_NODE_714_length_12645_cov_15.347760_4_plen_157_part_00
MRLCVCARPQLVKTNLVQPPHSNRYGMQIGSENTTGGGPQIDGTLMKSFELKWRDSKENREKHKGAPMLSGFNQTHLMIDLFFPCAAIQLDRVKKVGAGVVDGRMAAKDTTRNPMDRHMQPKPVAPKEVRALAQALEFQPKNTQPIYCSCRRSLVS